MVGWKEGEEGERKRKEGEREEGSKEGMKERNKKHLLSYCL